MTKTNVANNSKVPTIESLSPYYDYLLSVYQICQRKNINSSKFDVQEAYRHVYTEGCLKCQRRLETTMESLTMINNKALT